MVIKLFYGRPHTHTKNIAVGSIRSIWENSQNKYFRMVMMYTTPLGKA